MRCGMRGVGRAVVVAALLVACSGASTAAPTDVKVVEIGLGDPSGLGVSQVAWVDDWLVFDETDSTAAIAHFARYRLWRVRPDGSEIQKLHVDPSKESCPGSPYFGFSDPVRLSEGKVAFVETCAVAVESNGGLPSTSHLMAIRAIDLASLEPEPTVYAKMGNTLAFQASGAALHLAGSWFMTVDYRIDSPVERQLLLPRDGKRAGFPTAEFDLEPTRVWALSISPDGSRVAFAGASDGNEPHSRIDGQLYVSDPDFTEVRELGPPIYSLYGSSWSPDGRWILVAGVRNNTRGLWIMDSESGEMRLAAEGWFLINPSAWSPDGKRVAVTDIKGDERGTPAVIAVFDLTAILQ